MAKLSPVFNEQTLDSDNFLLSGGKIYWYLAGTSTTATTYTDATGVTANPNPVVLNSRGEPSSGIWLADGVAYKAVLKDAGDVLIRTIDNIRGVNDIDDQTISEWVLFSGDATYLSATTFSVTGNHVSTFSTDRRLKATITAGTWYGQVASANYSGGNTTVTVENDSISLDSGLDDIYYSVISVKSTPLQPAYDYADAAVSTLQTALVNLSFGATNGLPFKWAFSDLIIQAGTFNITIAATGTNTNQAVTFTDAFPTHCMGVLLFENDNTPRGLDALFSTQPTTTGFTATGRDEHETGVSRIFYVAFGY